MKKMLKRADGSYSQRGLWDNIRANKGSGKQPTKEMLKQEKKIKSKKQTGGVNLVKAPSKYQIEGAKKIKAIEDSVGKVVAQEKTFKKDSHASYPDTSKPVAPAIGKNKKQTGGTKFTVTGLSANAAPGKQCIGTGCKDVIAGGSSYAGVSGSNYTGAGATGLSSKPQYADRVVKKSPEQIAADQAVIDTRQAKMAANQADRQARREANLAAFKEATAPKPEVQYDFKRVYATEPGIQKTGGKKKSSWLEESKELKFGGKKKRMGGKNC